MNSKVDQLNDTLKQPQQAMAHAKPLHDQAPAAYDAAAISPLKTDYAAVRAALSSSEIFVMSHKEIF